MRTPRRTPTTKTRAAEEDEDAEAALDAEATTDAADAGGDPAAEAVVEPDAPLVDTETVDPPDEAVPDAHHLVETAGAPEPVDEAADADQVTAAPTRADLGVAGDETAAAGPLRPGDVAETPIAVWDQRAAQESWPSNGQWPRLRIPPAG